ncbi:MAG: DUF3291 domain-containing protein [Acidobacteria bacterium]|nr:DUF3291 domain-containing protein [Acidobacteriota bacterium]
MTLSLAQVNLAWMRYPLDDSRMADLRDEIDRINALGDRSPGCVWRFTTKGGAATDVRVLDDPRVLFNLTVWRSVEDLRRYVYHTEHAAFFRRRREWFVPPLHEPVAMWWVAPGERPSVEDAMARLDRLWRDGPSAEAFTLKRVYGPDDRLLSSSSAPSQTP